MGNPFKVGDRVRYSDQGLAHARDSYLNLGSTHRLYSVFRAEWERKRTLRGTVTFTGNPYTELATGVQWDAGFYPNGNAGTSETLAYLLEAAGDE